MAHRSFLRKGRRKRAETDRSRPCAPLSLFLTGGDLAREGGTSETENKEGGRGLGRWWRGFSNRLKAFDENNSHGSLSNKYMEGEEKWEGEAGEKKCIVVPHPSVKEDCVVPRRSRFADHNNKTPDKPNEHNNDRVKPRRSILCARFHLHSPGEKKVVVRKAVSFCKEVRAQCTCFVCDFPIFSCLYVTITLCATNLLRYPRILQGERGSYPS